MRVLVADDDEVVRVFVQRVAEHEGHDVLLCEDGRSALDAIQAEDPDLLITDLRMPGMDGFELVRQLRHLPRYRRLPIICLSSISERDDIVRLIEMGISDYVIKPVKPADLADRLRTVTRREQHWKTLRHRQEQLAQAR